MTCCHRSALLVDIHIGVHYGNIHVNVIRHSDDVKGLLQSTALRIERPEHHLTEDIVFLDHQATLVNAGAGRLVLDASGNITVFLNLTPLATLCVGIADIEMQRAIVIESVNLLDVKPVVAYPGLEDGSSMNFIILLERPCIDEIYSRQAGFVHHQGRKLKDDFSGGLPSIRCRIYVESALQYGEILSLVVLEGYLCYADVI